MMRLTWGAVAFVVAVALWAGATGRLARLTLSFRILDELRRPGPHSWLRRATPAPLLSPVLLAHRGRRFAADLYRPAAATGAVPLLLVPGLVEAGKDEPRVRPFAELLARAGFVVVVPDLPSFRSLRIHPDNLSDLAAAFDALSAERGLAPLGTAGMFGISYAGGVAVLAALDPARAPRVSFVAAAGGYADLDSVLRFLATGQVWWGGRRRAASPDPYGQLVFLRTYQEFLTEPGDREVLEAMAARRLSDPRADLTDLAPRLGPEGRLIYDLLESGRPESVPERMERLPPGLRQRMAQLSPARRSFAALRARLHLVHARDDGTLPVTESRRLAELARSRVPVRLVVLESLRHVDPQPWRGDPWGFLARDVPEALRLAGWWYGLLGERAR